MIVLPEKMSQLVSFGEISQLFLNGVKGVPWYHVCMGLQNAINSVHFCYLIADKSGVIQRLICATYDQFFNVNDNTGNISEVVMSNTGVIIFVFHNILW